MKARKEKPYYPARLMDTLAKIEEYALVAICAPSGSGKTTAVREYLARRKDVLRVLWYTSFGERANTSWERICDLCNQVDPVVVSTLRSLGFPRRETLSILAEKIQQVQCDTKTIIVIDNAQMLQSNLSHTLLNALAMHHNEQLHVVVITQNPLDTPTKPVSSPDVAYIGTDAFFFSADEACTYFERNECALTQNDLQQVMEHTMGGGCSIAPSTAGIPAIGEDPRRSRY